MPYTLKTIKNHLKKLNDNWNKDYWIFTADGGLILMRKKDGERVMFPLPHGGVNPNYIIDTYKGIEADGGDW